MTMVIRGLRASVLLFLAFSLLVVLLVAGGRPLRAWSQPSRCPGNTVWTGQGCATPFGSIPDFGQPAERQLREESQRALEAFLRREPTSTVCKVGFQLGEKP